jgi:hypothetical protein
MSIDVQLIDVATGEALHTEPYYLGGEGNKKYTLLIASTPQKIHGVFSTVVFSAATASTVIATPTSGGSIELTDLIITFERTASTYVEVRFNDGTHTETIVHTDLNDAPVNMAIPFNGNWQGWADAYVDVVITSGNPDGAVSIGYVKRDSRGTLKYDAWDARR